MANTRPESAAPGRARCALSPAALLPVALIAALRRVVLRLQLFDIFEMAKSSSLEAVCFLTLSAAFSNPFRSGKIFIRGSISTSPEISASMQIQQNTYIGDEAETDKNSANSVLWWPPGHCKELEDSLLVPAFQEMAGIQFHPAWTPHNI